MATELHNLKPAKGCRMPKKRVGRGDASRHGTYCTRGIKGQKARSGGKGGLKMRGFRAEFMSIPKLRGFKSIHPKAKAVNLSDISARFKAGETVSPETLVKAGLVRDAKTGVKVLGLGKIERKLTFTGCAFSKSAKEAVLEAGCKIEGEPVSAKGEAGKKKVDTPPSKAAESEPGNGKKVSVKKDKADRKAKEPKEKATKEDKEKEKTEQK